MAAEDRDHKQQPLPLRGLWRHRHQRSHLCEGTVKILQLRVPKTFCLIKFVNGFNLFVNNILISGLIYCDQRGEGRGPAQSEQYEAWHLVHI